jgi:hypothetical protein
MEPQKKKNKETPKKNIFKLIGIILYLIFIIYLFYLLISSGFNPIIITILLAFIVLTTIGPFLKPRKKKIYSRMFPERKNGVNEQKKIIKEQVINQQELNQREVRIPKQVNLEVEYRKSLITKCKNCGNIVPNFVKKCPFCNKNII